ncbi:MAG: hypothetical protein ABF593_12820, partial [Acetobacter papayae]|uniref:hypothetical protein n=1 Tax=Acetobacter papayae TaxID=1076592 RepID=UPI0039EAFE6C
AMAPKTTARSAATGTASTRATTRPAATAGPTTRMRQPCSGQRSAQAHAQQDNHRAFSQFSPFHERTTFSLIP